jgi:hypothetical protein
LQSDKTINELTDYSKCFVIEDFCRLYNTMQVQKAKINSNPDKEALQILSSYVPINLDSNKKLKYYY